MTMTKLSNHIDQNQLKEIAGWEQMGLQIKTWTATIPKSVNRGWTTGFTNNDLTAKSTELLRALTDSFWYNRNSWYIKITTNPVPQIRLAEKLKSLNDSR